MERDLFLQKTGECQSFLEEFVQKDESLSLEQRDAMEEGMAPLLLQGYFLMDRKVLSPQEYYQGCMTILLARFLEQGGGRPHSVIESLRTCLSGGGAASVVDGEENSSFLSLILDGNQQHPGLALEDWGHVLGLVSTIQSSVAVVKRRRQQKNWRLKASKQQQQRRLLLTNHATSKIAADSLDAMWVVPLSYIAGYVVYNSCRSLQQQEGKTLVSSWKRDIRPKIDEVLRAAFPRLRPNEFVDAGLMLLQLDLLQETSTSMPDVVNTASVAEDLMEE